MNYLFDVKDCFVSCHGGVMRPDHFSLFDSLKYRNYYLIGSESWHDMYTLVGKPFLYNAQAVFARNGQEVYIQSRLIEHHDIVGEDYSELVAGLPTPLYYFGHDLALAKAVTAIRTNSAFIVRDCEELKATLKMLDVVPVKLEKP